MYERDYIMRMIRQMMDVLLRLLKLKKEEDYDRALDYINGVYDDLFGIDASLLRAMDSATAARLLGHQEKIKALAKLCKEEAELYRLKGDAVQSKAASRRALELFLEAVGLEKEPDAESLNSIKELTGLVDLGDLSPAYRVRLERLPGS